MAFIGLVAFILCCIAIYQLCSHFKQNKKVVIGGKEYYAKPPAGYGASSDTARELIGATRSRDSDLSAQKILKGRFLSK